MLLIASVVSMDARQVLEEKKETIYSPLRFVGAVDMRGY